MGTLLDFSAAARPRRPSRARRPEGDAKILAFPGVRLDRLAVDLAARIRKVAKDTGGTAQPEA
ncbi:hypothetical protein [Breoghania sp. JC706]|uniref:hypothetical protein n=1 Tax=Breoghania sp. JC706 TaxID=3117732 RepID=UPI00300869F6